MDNIVEAKNLKFKYEDSNTNTLEDFSLCVKQGEFVVLLGKNGSGKTSFVRHLNILLELQSGSLFVAKFDAKEKDAKTKIRQHVGMVFQNPENQFVSSVVEEDIAFTLENYCTPEEQIPSRIDAALQRVSLKGFEKENIQNLSGGQKQRVAIAGIIVVCPSLIIFDESTSMLDDIGRREVIQVIQELHKQGITIILITHQIDEAAFAEKIAIIDKGKLVAYDTSRAILQNKNLLEAYGIEVPLPVQVYFDLLQHGINLASCPITLDELVEGLCQL